MSIIADTTTPVSRNDRGVLLTLLRVSRTGSAFIRGGSATARAAASLAADKLVTIRAARSAGVNGITVTLIGKGGGR